jgi:hypothetical protein
MTTAIATRAASVASIHLGPINESRRRAGLPAMTIADAEREFADVAHLPVRAKGSTLPTGTNQAAADALWGGIVARLNMTVPASRAPVGPSGERSSAAGSAKPTQASVDSMWAGLARNLNDEAGLVMPARRAR